MTMMAARPGAKPKIRAPRKGLSQNSAQIDFEETWRQVSECLTQMHTKNASNLSFEVVYRFAYKIVLKKMGAEFYKRFTYFENEWLGNQVRPSVQKLVTPALVSSGKDDLAVNIGERRTQGERMLSKISQVFLDHQQVMNMTTDVFMYLDRVYCSDHGDPPIYTLAMLLFRDQVLRTEIHSNGPRLQDLLTSVILDQIAMERDGDVIDKTRIKSCVYVLEGLYETQNEKEEERLYFTAFEGRFLESSRMFYKSEADRMLRESDAPTYCRQTRERINSERDRCRSTLSEQTTPKIERIVEEELIQGRIRDLIRSGTGLKPMVDRDSLSDLELIYDLNKRVDEQKTELREALHNYIFELGNAINEKAKASLNQPQAPAAGTGEDTTKDKSGKSKGNSERAVNQQTLAALEWVDSVLTLKEKFDRIWSRSFSQDTAIEPAIIKSFGAFVNDFVSDRNQRLAPEYLSLFMDENMKKGLKDKTELEVETILDKAITMLRYIDDKDKFESYYKKHLGKRLLMRKSVSMEVEKQMMERMKGELGNSFTTKMETMFKDMQVSEILTSGYKMHIRSSASKRSDLEMSVLTTTVWPLETVQSSSEASESQQCIYPAEMEKMRQSFEAFYVGKHNGRKLTWLPKLGSVDIKAAFPPVPGAKPGSPQAKERRHEVNVPTYAAIVLLLFNDGAENLTFDQIQAATNIPSNELIRALQSLAVAPKTRLLVKVPMSKDVKPTDRFSFNTGFVSPFVKIKVGMIAGSNKVETEKQREDTERKTDMERKFVVEAAIVRIMKSRKQITHTNLISEAIRQVSSRFTPDVPIIKAAIESLLDREYVERAEAETATYNYLA